MSLIIRYARLKVIWEHTTTTITPVPHPAPTLTIETSVLSGNWRRFSPYSSMTQTLGMRWLTETKSAVLKVPSAISEAEWNFLLNPAHADFQKLRIGNAVPFMMDPRVP
jgi:hypothetical protein